MVDQCVRISSTNSLLRYDFVELHRKAGDTIEAPIATVPAPNFGSNLE